MRPPRTTPGRESTRRAIFAHSRNWHTTGSRAPYRSRLGFEWHLAGLAAAKIFAHSRNWHTTGSRAPYRSRLGFEWHLAGLAAAKEPRTR